MQPHTDAPEMIREIIRHIAAGDPVSDHQFRAFSEHLARRERAGRTLLGPYAGTDPPFDTVSGRCGLRPPFAGLDE